MTYLFYIGVAIVLGGTIAAFAFMDPVASVSNTDGKCRIGLPLTATLPLLVYNIMINFLDHWSLLPTKPSSYPPAILEEDGHVFKSTLPFHFNDSDPNSGKRPSVLVGQIHRRCDSNHHPNNYQFGCPLHDRWSRTELAVFYDLYHRRVAASTPPFPLCLIANGALVTWSTIIVHLLTANPPDLEHKPARHTVHASQRHGSHTTYICRKPRPVLQDDMITILRSHFLGTI